MKLTKQAPDCRGELPLAVKSPVDWSVLRGHLYAWAEELGFDDLRVQAVAPLADHAFYEQWLAKGYAGEMDYLARHADLRSNPDKLMPGALSVISVRMNYLPATTFISQNAQHDHTEQASASSVSTDWRQKEWGRMLDPSQAVVSVYARGRDYHKVLRQRLQKLADRINHWLSEQAFESEPPFQARAVTDSAPIMEVALAAQAQLGWRGKHTLLLTREAGSFFFLGELLTNLPLAEIPQVNEAAAASNGQHCGSCQRCIDICPTKAIVAPYELDARRCISYLTIEHDGSIPLALRPLLGNHIYGCDDCQLICPWNKFAQVSPLPDFAVRHELDSTDLIRLFSWTEAQFKERMAGSPILRIGHLRWLRNIAVAMGNALRTLPENDPLAMALHTALTAHESHPDLVVVEHVQWALQQRPEAE